jgi:putative pyruvate formate lyase activating enzyme
MGVAKRRGRVLGWLAALARDSYLNLMDQYYTAWKVKTNPRFAEINRRVTRPEMAEAFELARGAGLWCLDDRWRSVLPLNSRLVALRE